ALRPDACPAERHEPVLPGRRTRYGARRSCSFRCAAQEFIQQDQSNEQDRKGGEIRWQNSCVIIRFQRGNSLLISCVRSRKRLNRTQTSKATGVSRTLPRAKWCASWKPPPRILWLPGSGRWACRLTALLP